ncbi:2,5-dihydroxypyridine 5,6-dioxygenase [Variovorax saccharolyticus]|uniref:2,5-dihydroxypyridine 5,6-dioxygenase n=1 Tax=Variovorax saccharolyticus TaxID=3053516 RepID=UPI0025776E10|nr:2,5-dihydroxypyridine 5,6-dioxygenase [Variovorax sp. J22R187]MDM0021870.1 2,5-dihydroxypyridine 5,6-dioxygenase [Variovorax sp. J22R187]
MPISDYQLVEGWKHVLKLSKIGAGHVVTVLTSANTHAQTLSTAMQAIASVGAVGNRLDVPPINGDKSFSRDRIAYLGQTALTGNPAAVAALKASDMVLDLMLLLFSPEQLDILESGTKILLVIEPPEILMRMLPTEEDRDRVKAAASLLEKAKEMRVTSGAGTDLVLPLGQYPVICEYGFVDEPGRWDHWPSGFQFTWPNEGAAQGRIVLDRGDILLPQKCYLNGPIAMTVKDGYVTAIEGGTDAALLRDYMEGFEEPEAYAFSHVGWGVQHRARWSTMALYDREAVVGQDARSYAGNFMFSLGPNTEVGGARATKCHIDIPVRGCTISLDGQPVIAEGKLLDNTEL